MQQSIPSYTTYRNICKEAYRYIGFMFRQANNYTNINAFKTLYKAPLTSHLEYNAAVWSPSEAQYKTMLEKFR